MILPTKSLAISYNQYTFFAKSLGRTNLSPFFHGNPVTTMFVGVMVRGFQVGRSSEVYDVQT